MFKHGRHKQAQGDAWEGLADLRDTVQGREVIPTGIGSDALIINPDGGWYLVERKSGDSQLTKLERETQKK